MVCRGASGAGVADGVVVVVAWCSVPEALERCSLLMFSNLTQAELSYSIRVLSRATWAVWGGQNRVDGLNIAVNLGVLTTNISAIAEYFAAVRLERRLLTRALVLSSALARGLPAR